MSRKKFKKPKPLGGSNKWTFYYPEKTMVASDLRVYRRGTDGVIRFVGNYKDLLSENAKGESEPMS